MGSSVGFSQMQPAWSSCAGAYSQAHGTLSCFAAGFLGPGVE